MIMIQRWDNPQQDIAQAIEDVVGAQDKQPLKPSFDFYTLLPKSQVTIPDVEPGPERGSEQQDDEKFLLQTGSFRNTSDADSLRIRLLLLNMDAHLETATSDSTGTWHRVIVGPFKSQSELTDARTTLLQNGIDNLVLKRK